MANTKKKIPSGLLIKRKGTKFSCKWKIGKDWKQKIQFSKREGKGKSHKWTNPTELTVKSTSRAININLNNWYPNEYNNGNKKPKLTAVAFKVKGDDGWADPCTFELSPPNEPTTAVNVGNVPTCTFSWNVKTKDTGHRPFSYVEYQSILSTKASYNSKNDKANVNWNRSVKGSNEYKKISNSASGSITITEDSGLINDGNSYTRWFRVRSFGPAGHSEWSRPKKHTYALPRPANINVKSIVVTKNTSANGYTCRLKFKAAKSATRPVDTYEVQYALAIPDAGMECPDGANWQTGYTAKAYDSSGGAEFSIDAVLAYDQCLFIRVNTVYDGRTTYGTPVLPSDGVGRLKAPTINSITTDDSTYKATVSATNNSDVEDSKLIVRYITESYPNGTIVGTIPHGLSSVIVQCEPWDSSSRIAFSVQAVTTETVNNDSEDMQLTSDTSVVSGKMYYEKVGTGTEDDPEDFIQVEEFAVGDNPHTKGWYESASAVTVSVDINMESAVVKQGGSVPKAPDKITVEQYKIAGTVRVTWDWTWTEADSAEISWADHEDAWESTDEPEVYEVTKMRASAWNISGLESGKKWYIRVRLISGIGDDRVYGAYSALSQGIIDLSSAPAVPSMILSEDTITEDGSMIVSWTYVSNDSTEQLDAKIYEITYTTTENNGVTTTTQNENPIVEDIGSAQRYTLKASDYNWSHGETHYLAVRTWSESNRESPLSNIEPIIIAEPPTCVIENTSMSNATITITNEDGTTSSESVLSLKEMPLTVIVSGSGDSAVAQVYVQRRGAYHSDRPDESELTGFDGETILSDYAPIQPVYTETADTTVYVTKQYFEYDSVSGSYVEVTPASGANPHTSGWYEKTELASFSFNNDDLIGRFDDEALYTLTAVVQDAHGESEPQELDFEVHWTNQALIPQAEATSNYEYMVSILKPVAPTGVRASDVCDIYRLSVDKPRLIIEGATFGEKYVDPYPTIGQFGGHRFVFRTANDDYITTDNEFAWVDLADRITSDYNIIEFGTGRVMLDRNVDLSNSWSKDFQQTNYLGGSVQGDWGKAVVRTGSISAVAITIVDQDTIESMRRLAEWTGICHVRTVDGSSYPADVQVSGDNYSHDTGKMIATFNLKITRVDTQELDGITYTEWIRTHPHG